jgi:hypothetical protein
MSMSHVERLLRRLDEIGQSLAQSGHGLALLGLGSVGIERARMDDYSDLDFFAIVEKGYKQDFIANIEWLSRIHPVAYAFKNTRDGYKLLYEDGIYCEMAVFEPDELSTLSYPEGQIVWKADHFDTPINKPQMKTSPHVSTTEWLLGEILTNLYVGLARYHRGEKLSAQRLIQYFAVDRILELAPQLETARNVPEDEFMRERRFEQRFPKTAAHLPDFVQGYDRIPESARAILTFLEAHFEVNAAIKVEIVRLYSPPT